jgi:transcriptional regulator of arginine metabolism
VAIAKVRRDRALVPKNGDIRRRALREILSTATIRSEEELREKLRERGFDVAQATVSRDLALLGAARMRSTDGWRYVLRQRDGTTAIRELALLEITSIAANESLIVVRTRVGHAAGAALFLDSLDSSDIIGTLAGNDTVLVIPDSHEHLPRLLTLLRQIVFGDNRDTD